jgi:hypothetical protein
MLFALYSLKRNTTSARPGIKEVNFQKSPRFKTKYHVEAISKLGVLASRPKDAVTAGFVDTIRFGSEQRSTFGYAVDASFRDAFRFPLACAKHHAFDNAFNRSHWCAFYQQH